MGRPDDPSPDPDSSRATLAVLVQLGFWLAVGSLVVGFPLCLGCGIFLPERLAPFAFLGVPIVFLFGVILAVGGSLLAERAFACEECRDWIADGSFPSQLRQCPRCGRWGRPGDPSTAQAHEVRGFPVIVPPPPARKAKDEARGKR